MIAAGETTGENQQVLIMGMSKLLSLVSGGKARKRRL